MLREFKVSVRKAAAARARVKAGLEGFCRARARRTFPTRMMLPRRRKPSVLEQQLAHDSARPSRRMCSASTGYQVIPFLSSSTTSATVTAAAAPTHDLIMPLITI